MALVLPFIFRRPLHPFGDASLLVSQRRVSAWTPAYPIFQLSAWFEASTSSCFTDTGGTTAVTADGDLVACIKDPYGTIIATQATSGKRPLYRPNAGRPYIEFDGIDDFLVSSSAVFTDTGGRHSAIAAFRLDVTTGVQNIVDGDDVTRVSQLLRSNAGTPETIAFNTAVTPFTDSAAALSATTNTVLSEITNSTSTEVFVNGTGNGSTAVTGSLQAGSARMTIGGIGGGSAAQYLDGRVYGFAVWKGALGTADHASAVSYFQALYASTAVSHATSGALTGDGSVIVGAAVYNAVHPTTGALTGPGSTIVGAAARTREHATTGALTGPGSTIVGVAVYNAKHATSGVLTGQDPTIVGSATRFHAFATSGVLTGQGSTIVGSAVYNAKHSTSGTLTGDPASVAGAATRFRAFATTGVLIGPGSTVVGAADHASGTTSHPTSAILVGQEAVLAGTAARTRVHTATGALVGPVSLVAGNAYRCREHQSSGAIPGTVGALFASVFNGTPQLRDIPVNSANLSDEPGPGAGTLQPVTVGSGQIVNHPPYPAA